MMGNKRIDVTKLYNGYTTGWFHVGNYRPMIEAFGNIAVQVDDCDYQGDTRILYDNDRKIGFLIFGWGSCSGCDALQACENIEEVQNLCNELQDDIKWFDSKEEALAWANEKDWDTEWFWHENEGREFVQKVIDYLSK
jgi:hypothetical protein